MKAIQALILDPNREAQTWELPVSGGWTKNGTLSRDPYSGWPSSCHRRAETCISVVLVDVDHRPPEASSEPSSSNSQRASVFKRHPASLEALKSDSTISLFYVI